jgi:pimeloyl-ACP methyl ester carboxylesterase
VGIFVLVHGAWHGAWCWYKVVHLLEAQGREALAIDLPGHGADRTPVAEVTLARYVETLCLVLESQAEPVVLVGHSMAGAVISQAAEAFPDAVHTLVYLTAYLLQTGESISRVARGDPGAQLGAYRRFSDDRKLITLEPAGCATILYHDCPPEDVALASRALCPQAVAPFVTPVQITASNYGRIPRVYIECLQDRAISLAWQRKMQSHVPCSKVVSLDTGHSPFFADPEALATHLTEL